MTKYLEEEFKTRLHKVIKCIKSYDIGYLDMGIFDDEDWDWSDYGYEKN